MAVLVLQKTCSVIVIVQIHLSPTKTVWNLTGIFLDNVEMIVLRRLTTVVSLVHPTKIVWPTAGLMKIFASQNVHAIPNVLWDAHAQDGVTMEVQSKNVKPYGVKRLKSAMMIVGKSGVSA